MPPHKNCYLPPPPEKNPLSPKNTVAATCLVEKLLDLRDIDDAGVRRTAQTWHFISLYKRGWTDFTTGSLRRTHTASVN